MLLSLKHAGSTSLTIITLRGIAAGLSDVPSPANLVRRSTAKAVVLGNYVYVDGGEISQLGDDGTIGKRTSNQVNSTLSIDISQSWKTDTVTIRTIPKASLVPTKENVHLWTDAAAGEFYSWGGKFFLGMNITKTQLYKFSADGSGGGQWSVQEPGNPSFFSSLSPGEFSATTTINNTGYVIGGIASGWTEIYRGKNQVLPGMLTFNTKTKMWQNDTLNMNRFDTLVGGEATYVPNFGPNGLVFLLGGFSPRADTEPDIKVSPIQDFRNLTFFDPVSKTIYWQFASGDIPPSPRGRFCTVGFRSKDNTFDIFLSGGVNLRDRSTYQDAYMLSLPGFIWNKLPDFPGGPRAEHACVGVGNRQVLSIGGTNPYDRPWTNKDPAPNGLLILDATASKWTHLFDAQAAMYESPDVVKAWYTKGSLDSVQWSSPDVEGLFIMTNKLPSPPTESNPSPPPAGGEAKSPISAGEIAGAVIGGVTSLFLVSLAVWFLRRKRTQSSARGPASSNDSTTKFHQLDTVSMHQLDTVNMARYEIGTLEYYELSDVTAGGERVHGQHNPEPRAGQTSRPNGWQAKAQGNTTPAELAEAQGSWERDR